VSGTVLFNFVEDYAAWADQAYAAENHLCRICGERVEESDEPAFDLTPTGECYEQPVHSWCAFLEQNGHAAEEIRAALVPEEEVVPLGI